MAYSYKGGYKPGEQRREPMPINEYGFIIIDAEECLSKKDNLMMSITFQPMDTKYERRKIFHYIVLDNEWAEKNVGSLLDAIGKNPAEAITFAATDLIGKTCNAVIKHEIYEGAIQEKIHYFVDKFSAVEVAENK